MHKLGFTLIAATLVAASAAALSATAKRGDAAVRNGRIAFEATVKGRQQVFTINPDGTGLRQVTRLTSPALWGVAWSPDSSALVFSAGFLTSGKGPDLLYRTSPTGGAVRRISLSCDSTCLGDDFPSYSPSGAKIAFERGFGPIKHNQAAGAAIFSMNANGSGVTQLTQKKTPASSEDHGPSWSPDGRKIAFERLLNRAADATEGAIFVMNANGTNARRLTPSALKADDPKWSPDGTEILFDSYGSPRAKSRNIYSIKADGSELTQLTHYSGGAQQAYMDSWSPDSTQIIIHVRGPSPNGPGVNQLFAMNADGTQVRQLTHLRHGTNPERAAWGAAQ